VIAVVPDERSWSTEHALANASSKRKNALFTASSIAVGKAASSSIYCSTFSFT
jgi:hypothetical protein